jgi:hypothetical protein
MRFTPRTDQEIAEANLLPAGEYDYEVAQAHDKKSSAGNEMIELKLRIFFDEGERTVTDYLLEATAGKLKHFCYSHGMGQHYENGTLQASDCTMLTGKCKLKIEKGKNGYADKNAVADYLVSAIANVVNVTPRAARPNGASDIPAGFPTSGDIPAF